jgi:hypothetical protein
MRRLGCWRSCCPSGTSSTSAASPPAPERSLTSGGSWDELYSSTALHSHSRMSSGACRAASTTRPTVASELVGTGVMLISYTVF